MKHNLEMYATCESRPPTLRKKYIFRVLEKRLLKTIFGLKMEL
jgi:hypothetical protein